ncbi:MAG: hypothetical protein MJ146_01095 [Clostridia bacterium]|nr:hypothetical protein [Clostridia bacterium]
MKEKILRWLAGDEREYERLEPNFFGRYDDGLIQKQIQSNLINAKRIILAMGLILLVLLLKTLLISDGYIYEKGKVIALEGRDKVYSLVAKTSSAKKDMTITFPKEKKDRDDEIIKDDSYYIDQVKRQIESSKARKINLPSQLLNGSKVTFKKGRDLTLIYLLFIFSVIIFAMRKGRYIKLKTFKEKARQDVLNQLPMYINKILITWKSGATLYESLRKASSSPLGSGFFEENVHRILCECSLTGDNLIERLNDFAISVDVREFKRITNVILENQSKGSYLLDKLEEERINIWEKRKERAIEEGKKSETKLVIPMSMLLIALIVVTSCPAFLNM